jgi:hypothetical protein
MRSSEASSVPSSLLNVGMVPLEQVPALSVAVDDMVQRAMPGSALIPSPSMVFSSSI